jgi:hypothetical protein
MKEWETPVSPVSAAPARLAKARRSRRRLRKQLRLASMSVGLARLQLHTTHNPRGAAILHEAHRQIEALCRHLDREKSKSGAKAEPVASPRRRVGEQSLTRNYPPALLQAIDA